MFYPNFSHIIWEFCADTYIPINFIDPGGNCCTQRDTKTWTIKYSIVISNNCEKICAHDA